MANESGEVEAWSRRLSRTIGLVVRRYRVDRGLQVGDLAERTAELGHEVTAQKIYNLETGRRGDPSVADLVAIAAALDVPLVLLLAPLDPPAAPVHDKALTDYPATVEVLPGRTVAAHEAIAWHSGTEFPDTADTDERAEDWMASVEVLNLYRLANDLVLDLLADDNGVDGAELDQDERIGALRQLAETRTRLDERGLPLPELPPGIDDELATPKPRRRARTAGRRAVRGATTTEES